MTDGYNMKIPQELADFVEKDIKEHPELGFKFISQYVTHLLREDIKKITSNNSYGKEEKKIHLYEGNYTREEIEKLLKKG